MLDNPLGGGGFNPLRSKNRLSNSRLSKSVWSGAEENKN
jgi:hypothetical protein